MRKLLLGFDIGSSSVKATLLDADTGKAVSSEGLPKVEMPIDSPKKDWAEQDPMMWWNYAVQCTQTLVQKAQVKSGEIKAIGISYQMHGLVVVDAQQQVLRPAIIWCDSRAVEIGNAAFDQLGADYCLPHLLNSPGNFTASKLRWVQENEPALYEKIHKIMLPGDFIAMKLSGEILTSESGLSEGIFWDFKSNGISQKVLDVYQIDRSLIPEVVPSFSIQSKVNEVAAAELGIDAGIPICYRAGDQPNNALSLNVLKAGELATTAGTSGTVYGVTEEPLYDPKSRVNTFVHVNHTAESPRYGVLLCVNGTGILNSWVKRLFGGEQISYPEMNNLAAQVPVGAEGLTFIPFGNGVERIMENRPVDASLQGLNLLKHDRRHVLKAAQEGIVSSLTYGFDIMKAMGLDLKTVKAGHANMFLSPIFREAFVNMNQVSLELYDTDGSQGAARGAGIGLGLFTNHDDAFAGLEKIASLEPDQKLTVAYQEVYENWKSYLNRVKNK
ncbi:xylulokinase [Belliella kenyensis]|uniref:Xylulokinase n=1 Tax=Belliella kenyensis TaxID=1472724 RepID=A0ABV8ENC0_9BACT|nr:FGGY family carbohydrate kinase [Belliella kenyensis]MCH7402012.1 FGGY family carbohydrate kinase [Belliella kenyensis]MDN3605176.1 FGGY family carbohydrate kinase [Belliella kenyensis]